MNQKQHHSGELERVQRALLAEREKFSLFLSLNTNCFFEYDEASGVVAFAKNESFVKLNGSILGLSEDTFVKKSGIFPEDYSRFYQQLHSFRDEVSEMRFQKDNGEYNWSLVKTAVLNQKEGEHVVIGCINDNNENHKREEAQMRAAQCDPLTGVYNADYIKHLVDECLKGAGHDESHALFLVDLTDFSLVNDTYGRLFGDTVLVNIVEEIRKHFSEHTVIGRVGGDEFAIFFEGVEEKEIDILGKKVREEIRKVYAGGKGEAPLTCSVGVARFPQDGLEYGVLFRKADLRLFRAKASESGFCDTDLEGIEVGSLHEEGQYYNQYCLHFAQDTEKNRYHFGQELTQYAHDLMATTKDAYSAIKILLERIGKEYHLSSVIILEKVKGRKYLCETYRWDEEWKAEREKIKFNYEPFFKNRKYFNKDNLMIVDDINTLEGTEEISEMLMSFQTKALMQSAFYEEGDLRGMICIKDDQDKREWTAYEIETFLSLSRIISVYLLRLRVSEKIQEHLDHMKNYDTLTGMPTLYKFKKDAAERVMDDPGDYAIVYCDIGNFKFVNDVYGYKFGDWILYEFVLKFANVLPESSLIGRISADNFVALVPFSNQEGLREKMEHFSEQFHDAQREKHIGTSLVVATGICVLKEGDVDINTAIDNANVARKSIKGGSIGACRYYDKEMEERIHREQEITNEMEDALKNGEFLVYLQPKVSLEEEMLVGAEALVRWKRKDGTIISPDEFIPLFERNGFIVKLDFYVYEEACKIIRWWLNQGVKAVPISVNVSRVHLSQDNFVQQLKDLVDNYFIPPEYLELELTESLFISDTEVAINVMKELRHHGFCVSIDDFGAGYSSLTLLKDMTTDVLKLDKEFFARAEMQEEERIIVTSIIDMAKKLNMKVLSEGIETEKQTQFLKDINCDMVQGYYYAKPMPIEEFEELMKSTKNNLAK